MKNAAVPSCKIWASLPTPASAALTLQPLRSEKQDQDVDARFGWTHLTGGEVPKRLAARPPHDEEQRAIATGSGGRRWEWAPGLQNVQSKLCSRPCPSTGRSRPSAGRAPLPRDPEQSGNELVPSCPGISWKLPGLRLCSMNNQGVHQRWDLQISRSQEERCTLK